MSNAAKFEVPGAGDDGKAYTYDEGGDAHVLTDVATQAELNTHAGLTTSVHGITDTSALVTTSTALGGDLTGTVGNAQIASGAIVNADVSASAAIALSKLATDPLARANHSGSQAASTISDFSEAVDDRVAALLVAGSNVTLTYDDGAGTLTVAASSSGSGPTYVFKSMDESVTSSTTLQDDDALLFAVLANSVYVARFVVFYTASTTGDIKLAVTVPASASVISAYAAARTTDQLLQTTVDAAGGTAVSAGGVGAGSVPNAHAIITVRVSTAGTAGNVTMQFAQNTSDGNATTVRAGSWVEYTKVA